jgi:hypothetical protein
MKKKILRSTPEVEAAVAKLIFVATEGGPVIMLTASRCPF